MKVTLYCFYDFSGFNLSECTDKFADEFLENGDWLRFGFHAHNAESYMDTDVDHMRTDYTLVAKELHRIIGFDEEDLSRSLRLDRFAGTKKQLTMLKQEFGVKTFLTEDDEKRQSCCMDNYEQDLLYEQDYLMDGEIFFTPTDIRMETLEGSDDLDYMLSKHKDEKYLAQIIHGTAVKMAESHIVTVF